jgi:hypothetical protein
MEPKQRYEKPELVTIQLKLEEVLAVGCKQVGRTNVGTLVPNCGIGAGCNRLGS